MSKVDTIYSWVNENLGKVHFTKEQKIKRVGLTVNRTTKNGEVTEDSTLSFTLDGGNIISLKDGWIDEKITLAENEQSMIVLLTDEAPLAIREIIEGVLILSNDPSLYDKLPKDPSFYNEELKVIDGKLGYEIEEKSETKVSNIGKVEENGTSAGEVNHPYNNEEKNVWPSKEFKDSGYTFTVPIVRIEGNTIVQNYIKNNNHGNLGIVYFNEKYGFGGNGNFEVHKKHCLGHSSERFVIVTEGDEQYEEAPCLVLDENEEVRVLTPTWAVESGKPSILCAKGTDNDRYIIYPKIDYPTPIMGTLVESEKQFDNLFNFKPLNDSDIDDMCINLENGVTNAISDCARKAKNGECEVYDGEKDAREIGNKYDAELHKKIMSINTGEIGDNLKGLVGKFVDDTTSKIEKDGCAAKNFKEVNQVATPLPQIKSINFDNTDEKTKEFVKNMLKESENFSRKVYGNEAVDATLKCMNNRKNPNLNESVKVQLGEEEADEKDKEEIAEAIANGSGCLEEAVDNEVDKHFQGIAEYMRKMNVSTIYFYLEGDGTVNCELRSMTSYPKK